MRPILRPVLILTQLLVLSFASCRGAQSPPPPAADLLTAMQAVMTQTAQPLPAGLVYSRTAASDGPDYLTATFFTALYGRAAEGLLETEEDPQAPAPLGDAALFLSVAPYPCELAVFRCSDTDVVPTVVALCRGRLDTVLDGYEEGKQTPTASGLVVVKGCFVFLVIAEDPQAVAEGALAALEAMR